MAKEWITQEVAAGLLHLSIRRVLEYCTAGVIATNPPNGTRFNGIPAKTLLKCDVEKLARERERKSKSAELRALNSVDREKVIDMLAEAPRPATKPEIIDGVIYYNDAAGQQTAVFLMCKWVTLEQASQMVGLSRRVLRARILHGKLPALRDESISIGKAQPGDCWRVKVSDLQAIAGEFHAGE
jgi:hypothetical protein